MLNNKRFFFYPHFYKMLKNFREFVNLEGIGTTSYDFENKNIIETLDLNQANSILNSGVNKNSANGDEHIEKIQVNFSIICYFLHQDEMSRKHFWNRAVTWYTGSDIIHCEIYFPVYNLTCSVDSKRPVHIIRKRKNYYFERNWEGLLINLDEQEHTTIYSYCLKQLGKPFDKNSIRFFPCIGCCTQTQGKSWICSKLIIYALLNANVLSRSINVDTVTPSDLYNLINSISVKL